MNSVQVYLFEGLLNAIAVNPEREANMAALRSGGIVPWLLALVADQKLHGEILQHAVSLLREFLMEDALEDEVKLVANFALTAAMMHSQREMQSRHNQQQLHQQAAQQQQPPGTPDSHSNNNPFTNAFGGSGSGTSIYSTSSTSTAAAAVPVSYGPAAAPSALRGPFNPSLRRFTIGGAPSSSSATTSSTTAVQQQGSSKDGLSSLGIGSGYLSSAGVNGGGGAHASLDASVSSSSSSIDSFARELCGFRLGSFLSARVRRSLIELLLDVLSKVQHSSKHLDTFVSAVDFHWIFAVLYTLDQAVQHRTHRLSTHQQQQQYAKEGLSSPPAASSVEDDEEIACDRACALLSLKILLTLLSHPRLHKRFQSLNGFASLGQLLLPYAHLDEVYAITLAMLLGKGVYDIPTIPNSNSPVSRG